MSDKRCDIRRVENGYIVSTNPGFGVREQVFTSLEDALKEICWQVGDFTVGQLQSVEIVTKMEPKP